MLSLSDNNQSDFIEVFDLTARYLNDLLNIDNYFFKQMVSHIYPTNLFFLKNPLILKTPFRTWTCP